MYRSPVSETKNTNDRERSINLTDNVRKQKYIWRKKEIIRKLPCKSDHDMWKEFETVKIYGHLIFQTFKIKSQISNITVYK